MSVIWPRSVSKASFDIFLLGVQVTCDSCVFVGSTHRSCLSTHGFLPSKVQKLLERPGNQLATFDQCQFGLVSPSGKPMQKRTKFMTNLGPLFNALNGKFCDHSHEHELIQGSENGVKRSAWAQTYPDGLVRTICHRVLDSQRSIGV